MCVFDLIFFRIHISARVEKAVNKRLLDRIDVVSAHDGPKHVSLHVNCLDDVIARCAAQSGSVQMCFVFTGLQHFAFFRAASGLLEYEHRRHYPEVLQHVSDVCAGTGSDDILRESIDIKTLKGIESFMHPL